MNKIFPRSRILDGIDFLIRMFPYAVTAAAYLAMSCVIAYETAISVTSKTGMYFVILMCSVPVLFLGTMWIMVMAVFRVLDETGRKQSTPPDPPTPPTPRPKNGKWTRVYENNKHTWNIHNDDND